MTTRARIGIAIAAAFVFSTMVLAQDVTRDWDKTYDFKLIKTFAIKIGTSWNNQLSEKRVMTEIAEEIGSKGWHQVAEDKNPDALVILHGATEVRHTLNTFYSGYGGYGYGGWGGATMGSGTTTVSDYLVGTLVVDIFDAKTKNLLFRGTASDEINKDPNKNVKKIDKAATKLFKDFPEKKK